MSWLSTLRRLRAVLADGNNAALGDIAVLKSDLVGVDVVPRLRPLLDPVRGYLPSIDLDALAALPGNTFGHAYAEFVRTHDLSLFVVTDAVDAEMRRRNAFGIRYAVTHDMFHVLLGFGPDWPGEMGVLAFAVGQGYTRAQVFAAAFAWLIYPFRCGFNVGALLRAWRRGYGLGAQAPFLLGLRLEERFGEDLMALRRELSLDDASTGSGLLASGAAPGMPGSAAIARR